MCKLSSLGVSFLLYLNKISTKCTSWNYFPTYIYVFLFRMTLSSRTTTLHKKKSIHLIVATLSGFFFCSKELLCNSCGVVVSVRAIFIKNRKKERPLQISHFSSQTRQVLLKWQKSNHSSLTSSFSCVFAHDLVIFITEPSLRFLTRVWSDNDAKACFYTFVAIHYYWFLSLLDSIKPHTY